MLIKKREIIKLFEDIRKIIDGQTVDFRDNREGTLSVLKINTGGKIVAILQVKELTK